MWLSIKPIISNFAALNNGLVPLNGPKQEKDAFFNKRARFWKYGPLSSRTPKAISWIDNISH
jgi:hypothetical protein